MKNQVLEYLTPVETESPFCNIELIIEEFGEKVQANLDALEKEEKVIRHYNPRNGEISYALLDCGKKKLEKYEAAKSEAKKRAENRGYDLKWNERSGWQLFGAAGELIFAGNMREINEYLS